MGLDMYARTLPAGTLTDEQQIGFSDSAAVAKAYDAGQMNEIFYWRKHHDLHGWMEQLWERKGGEGMFNCEPVRLLAEDLDELEAALGTNALPPTTGFFFGNNPPDDESREADLEFIAAARKALADGLIVFYTSWW